MVLGGNVMYAVIVILFGILILQLNIVMLMDIYGRVNQWWIGSRYQTLFYRIIKGY